MIDYYRWLGPWLRRLDAERAHGLAIRLLKNDLVPRPAAVPDDPRLAVEVLGLRFTNPIGLAAGFDKNAEVIDAMLGQGFGFVEAGSVTPRPQAGNPKPRMFRLPEDAAVINRLGFNNQGLEPFVERLRRRREGPEPPVGVVGANLGKNKDSADAAADYVQGLLAVSPHVDYVAVNISSPNTPGLRALQSRAALDELLSALDEALEKLSRKPPLFLKIAPDLTDEDKQDIAAVVSAHGVSGLIVGNTTLSRPPLVGAARGEAGGLSGAPLLALSTQVLSDMYRLTGGKLVLIGCGGVRSGADAYAKIRAGATLVQLYTALVYGGPRLVTRIKQELAALLAADGHPGVASAVGAAHTGS